jgi:hypothetical protein
VSREDRERYGEKKKDYNGREELLRRARDAQRRVVWKTLGAGTNWSQRELVRKDLATWRERRGR